MLLKQNISVVIESVMSIFDNFRRVSQCKPISICQHGCSNNRWTVPLDRRPKNEKGPSVLAYGRPSRTCDVAQKTSGRDNIFIGYITLISQI